MKWQIEHGVGTSMRGRKERVQLENNNAAGTKYNNEEHFQAET